LSGLIDDIGKSLGELDPETLKELKREKYASLKNLDKDLAKAKKEIENISFLGKGFSGWGSKMFNWLTKPIEKELKQSDFDTDYDFDLLTGKRKSLSSALYDVSIERGIESKGLLYLIRALPDLEAFLYSTSVKKYYRDHTEHALRVAVLGDFILEQDLGQGLLVGIISDLTEIDKKLLKEKFWWITGLIHDIGYPLGKMTTAVNYSLLNQLLKCYPTIDLELMPIELNLSWKGDQEDYLKLIEEGLSKEARSLIRKGVGYDEQQSSDKKPKVFLKQENGHPEFIYESPITLDHGVLSALCLLNGLGTPQEIKKNDELEGYLKVAKAIALHNFKAQLKDYIFDDQPLTFFLMLIDELQEWGRPIPIQIRDTYFTTELKKVTLLDEISLNLDDFSWLMQFRNEQAKNLMNFDFKFFSNEKRKSFGRLNRGDSFTKTKICLQDVKEFKKRKEKDNIIAEDIIEI